MIRNNAIQAILCLLTIIISISGLAAAVPAREWTVLVYMNADNNLEEVWQHELFEMAKASPLPQVEVLVAYDGPKQQDIDGLMGKLDRLYSEGVEPEGGWDDWFGSLNTQDPAIDTEDALEAFINDQPKLEKGWGDERVYPILEEIIETRHAYWRARLRFSEKLNMAASKISEERSRQEKRCDDLKKEAEETGAEVRCHVCDIGPANTRYRIQSKTQPDLKFSALVRKQSAWEAYFRRAKEALGRGDGGFSQRLGQAMSGWGGGGSEDPKDLESPQEMLDAEYAESLRDMKGGGDLGWLIERLDWTRRRWNKAFQDERTSLLEFKAALPRLRNEMQADLSRVTKEVNDILSGASAAARAAQSAGRLLEETPWFKEDGRNLYEQSRTIPEKVREARDGLSQSRRALGNLGKDIQQRENVANNRGIYADYFANALPGLRKMKALFEKHWALAGRADGTIDKFSDYGGTDAENKALLKELQDVRKEITPLAEGLAPRAVEKLDKMVEIVQSRKALPDDAIHGVINGEDVIVTVRDYQALGKQLDELNLSDLQEAEGEAASLMVKIEELYPFSEASEMKHPAYAAKQAALVRYKEALKGIEAKRVSNAGEIDKEYLALEQQLKALENGKSRARDPLQEFDKLEKKLEDLGDRYQSKLTSQSQAKVKYDPFTLLKRLPDIKKTLEDRQEDSEAAALLKKLQEILQKIKAIRPSSSSADQVRKLQEQAGVMAQDSGVGGHPDIRDVMQEISDASRDAIFAAPNQGMPTGSVSSTGKLDEKDQKMQDLVEDAADDIAELGKQMERLPPGPERVSRIEDFLSRIDFASEKAYEDLKDIDQRSAAVWHKQIEATVTEIKKIAFRMKKGGAAAPKDPGAASRNVTAIRAMYKKMAGYFSAKDVDGILMMLTNDWETGEGIIAEDMETNLRNSFDTFDSVSMRITSLVVQPYGGGKYMASYKTELTGKIRQNDITHKETSSQKDIVVMTGEGPRISKTTGKTAWVK